MNDCIVFEENITPYLIKIDGIPFSIELFIESKKEYQNRRVFLHEIGVDQKFLIVHGLVEKPDRLVIDKYIDILNPNPYDINNTQNQNG